MSTVQRGGVVEHPSYRDPMREVISSLRDGDLVEQAQAGNQALFERMVERYPAPLYQFVARYFGDYDQRCDVLQHVLIQLHLSLPDLQTNKPLQAWLFRVARNRCLNELRRRHVPNFSELAAGGNEVTAKTYFQRAKLRLRQSLGQVVG